VFFCTIISGASYRIGDDEQVGVGASFGASLSEALDNGGVGIEQVITGHARLAGYTGGNEDNLGASQALLEVGITLVVASNDALCVDVGNIGCNTGGTTDIVKGELGNSWVELEKEREGLTDTSSSTEDGDTGVL
jgi:hypothetical protein